MKGHGDSEDRTTKFNVTIHARNTCLVGVPTLVNQRILSTTASPYLDVTDNRRIGVSETISLHKSAIGCAVAMPRGLRRTRD